MPSASLLPNAFEVMESPTKNQVSLTPRLASKSCHSLSDVPMFPAASLLAPAVTRMRTQL